jgi:hypothetical protein
LTADSASAAHTGAAGHSAAPIPGQTLRQIKAEYGRFTYVPSVIPRGFIFTSWRIQSASATVYAPVLSLTFGRNGTRLVWRVFDARDWNDLDVYTGGDCSKRPYFSSSRRLAGKLVYYSKGNHGDSAWTCSIRPVGISLWVANDAARPSAAVAMRMVASARPA